MSAVRAVQQTMPLTASISIIAMLHAMPCCKSLNVAVPSVAIKFNGRLLSNQHSACVEQQAGAGLVADSVPEMEYEETVNKAAALGRAIDLAEQAFL